jgi:hypothetical protein
MSVKIFILAQDIVSLIFSVGKRINKYLGNLILLRALLFPNTLLYICILLQTTKTLYVQQKLICCQAVHK